MKILIQLILILSLNTAFGQTPIEFHSQSEAQMALLRGQIDNFRRAISERTSDVNFNVRDYAEQALVDQGLLDAAMVKFEDTLQKEVFQKLEPILAQYMTILNHKGFSSEQKELILNERFKQLQEMSARLQPVYQKAIREVYRLVPNVDIEAEFIFPVEKDDFRRRSGTRERTVEIRTNKGTSFTETLEVRYDDKIESAFRYTATIAGDRYSVVDYGRYFVYSGLRVNDFPGLNKIIYQTVIYPSLKGSSRSRLCVSLRSADQLTLLRLIQENIDKPLTLALPRREVISIPADNTDIRNILEYLQIVDFPDELPFQI